MFAKLILDEKDTVLDLGCGEGSITLPLAEKVKSVTGVDSSPKMLELLNQRAEKNKKLYESLKSRLADKTVSDIMCVFKSIWKYCKENGYPCCEFTLPSVKVNHTRKINIMPQKTLEKVEFALMKDISTVNAGIILALFAGIRIG